MQQGLFGLASSPTLKLASMEMCCLSFCRCMGPLYSHHFASSSIFCHGRPLSERIPPRCLTSGSFFSHSDKRGTIRRWQWWGTAGRSGWGRGRTAPRHPTPTLLESVSQHAAVTTATVTCRPTAGARPTTARAN